MRTDKTGQAGDATQAVEPVNSPNERYQPAGDAPSQTDAWSQAVAIAEGEHAHWIKEAAKHRRPGGYRSDHAEHDLERARVAQRVADKLKAAALSQPSQTDEITRLKQALRIATNTLDKAGLIIPPSIFDALSQPSQTSGEDVETELEDDFDGDNVHLIRCIEALIAIDATGKLVPHGIGGHARGLLSAAAVRLAAALSTQTTPIQEQVCETVPVRQSGQRTVEQGAHADDPSLRVGMGSTLLTQVTEALEFYADPETYHATSFLFDRPCGGFDDDFGPPEEHGHEDYDREMPGKTARGALRALSALAVGKGE